MRQPLFIAVALATSLSLVACGGSSSSRRAPPPDLAEVTPGPMVLLTAGDALISLDRADPGNLSASTAITGLATDDTLVGIAYRPATGDLYGVGLLGNLYVVDDSTGAVTSTVTLIPSATSPTFAGLDGEEFGVDFNPVPDRLRVVSDNGQNLRINVDTGEVIIDGAVNGAPDADITGSAYTNSFAGTATTRLFSIDSDGEMLYLQNPPNDGTQTNPVTLGVDASDHNGFVLDGRTNEGFAAFTVDGRAGLYYIDVNATENAAALIGLLDVSGGIKGIAIPPATPMVYTLTEDNELASFSLTSPGSITTTAITGLSTTPEALLGIDFRPATGDLYAVSALGKIYTLNTGTGAATEVATLGPAPAPDDDFVMLDAGDYVLDFNPVPDRLRLMSELGQNLRINVDTGAALVDGSVNLAGATPVLTAAAYTNSYANPPGTQLYTIDIDGQQYNLQNPPNDGTQVPQGALPIVAAGDQGFDIAGGDNGLVLVALSDDAAGPHVLYKLNLTTGAFTLVGADAASSTIGGASGPSLRSLAIDLQ